VHNSETALYFDLLGVILLIAVYQLLQLSSLSYSSFHFIMLGYFKENYKWTFVAVLSAGICYYHAQEWKT
jgi:hypothetical protein